ncbi:MAG: glycosyltransferase family 4 protein [Sphingomonadales bacterium]|nr:glycosyltransferase family 4 protein [Sphingomonadales bacterium]NCP50524.1 glycosyltransferase family 4 protein [Sphingomonadales bacterium]
MKILFTHRYFWPDTPPYAAMLRTIAEYLAREGHDVHLFASQPSYGLVEKAARIEELNGVHIHRIGVLRESKKNPFARAFNVLVYCIGLFYHIIRKRPDVVTAATFPPIAAGWTASLAAGLVGAKFVYHMQDVHPEVSKYAGGRLGRGFLLRFLVWLDNQTLRRAAAIIVLSQDMANTLTLRDVGKTLPIQIINNFQLRSFSAEQEPPQELKKPANKRRIIFAGNLGKFQNLELLTDGIALCFGNHPDLELLLLGDGEMKFALEQKWGLHPQVQFGPFLPFVQAEKLIRASDVGLVSLSPDIYNVSYPSKVLTYLGLGIPMLALVEPHSALAKEILDNGLGVVPDAATPQAIASALEALLFQRDTKESVVKYHQEKTRMEVVLQQWQGMLHSL